MRDGAIVMTIFDVARYKLLFRVFAVGAVGKTNNEGLLCRSIFHVGRGKRITGLGCYLVVWSG